MVGFPPILLIPNSIHKIRTNQVDRVCANLELYNEEYMSKGDVPKLYYYVTLGSGLVMLEDHTWAQGLSNVTVTDPGPGLPLPQAGDPHKLGKEIVASTEANTL